MSHKSQNLTEIKAILSNQLPFQDNIEESRDFKRFICDHRDTIENLAKGDVNNICTYRSNNMWEMELHKKMFHPQDAQTELSD